MHEIYKGADLTLRQIDIHYFMLVFQAKYKVAPTIRDMADSLSIASQNGVICHVKLLKKKGWLRSHGFAVSRGFVAIDARDVSKCPYCIVTPEEIAAYDPATAQMGRTYHSTRAKSYAPQGVLTAPPDADRVQVRRGDGTSPYDVRLLRDEAKGVSLDEAASQDHERPGIRHPGRGATPRGAVAPEPHHGDRGRRESLQRRIQEEEATRKRRVPPKP